MKRLAVIGHPVAHSRSPAMQTAALAAAGLGDGWTYGAIDIEPIELPAQLARLAEEGYIGVNVTIPHKEAALLLASAASERAREIGAANTLTFAGGLIHAENTDATAIESVVAGTSGPALVVGAGGSARAAIWGLRNAGLDVSVWNRTPERAASVAEELGASVAAAAPDLATYGVIVNATPVGLGGPAGLGDAPGEKAPVDETPQVERTPPSGFTPPDSQPPGEMAALKGFPISADGLSDRQVVVDLAYGPVDTPAIAAAKAAGARWIDGLEILVRQGAESFRIWTGIDPPLDVMRRAAAAGQRTDSADERTPITPSPGTEPGS